MTVLAIIYHGMKAILKSCATGYTGRKGNA
jgi:hypothetical protein